MFPGMAYRFTDISALFEILVSVKVRTHKISAISYRFGQISALNIGCISVIFRRYIGKTPIYRQFPKYRLSVSVKLRTETICHPCMFPYHHKGYSIKKCKGKGDPPPPRKLFLFLVPGLIFCILAVNIFFQLNIMIMVYKNKVVT